jgi:hypothetical protein
MQKNGLTFKDRNLDISFNESSSLNTSGKKRTLSETMEDELLGGTAVDTSNNDDDDDAAGEPEAKRRNQSQISDVDENEESGDDEARLLALSGKPSGTNEKKRTNLSHGSHHESNQQYEFESNNLDDEVQLLDS